MWSVWLRCNSRAVASSLPPSLTRQQTNRPLNIRQVSTVQPQSPPLQPYYQSPYRSPNVHQIISKDTSSKIITIQFPKKLLKEAKESAKLGHCWWEGCGEIRYSRRNKWRINSKSTRVIYATPTRQNVPVGVAVLHFISAEADVDTLQSVMSL